MAEKNTSGTKTKRVLPPRPLFVVMRVIGDDGQPLIVNKDRVEVIAASRNAGEVLEAMESGKHPGAFYKKVMVGK